MALHDPLAQRIAQDLEPILALPDPRTKISAYHSMPYAIFRYDPAEEFALRSQVSMLQTRLEQRGKRVTRISLAECLDGISQDESPPIDIIHAREVRPNHGDRDQSGAPYREVRTEENAHKVVEGVLVLSKSAHETELA